MLFLAIACLFITAFLGGYAIVQKPAIKAGRQAQAIEQGKISASIDNEPLACEALVTRVFEQRMVDAGIMTVAEMTTCESERCKDCAPTREANKPKRELRTIPKPPPGGGGVSRAAGRSRYDKKTIRVGGRNIDWPTDVPEYANVVVDYDVSAMCDRVVFRWTNPQDGKQLWRTMRVPNFFDRSGKVEVFSDQHEKPVVSLPRRPSDIIITTSREHRESLRRSGYRYTSPPSPAPTKLQIEYLRAQQKRAKIAEKRERRRKAVESLTKRQGRGIPDDGNIYS